MERWRGITETPPRWGRSAVTIGVFDGVHRGHQHIIGRAVDSARRLDASSVVVTFDPHPAEVVRPGSQPLRLSTLDRRAELISQLGVDGLCVQPFTKDFSRLSPEAFVHDLLVDRLHTAHVVVGENFRFGHKAAGDVALLEKLGQTFGFTTEPVALSGSQSMVYSSTYVRSCVDAGDVASAAQALGRPHRVSGTVVHGADRGGSRLGFPTANLSHDPYAAVPADGVYAGWFSCQGGPSHMAAISVGTNPTFAGTERSVEAYVLDFSDDVYDREVNLDFVARVREQRTYDAIEPLIEQMHADVAQTRKLLSA